MALAGARGLSGLSTALITDYDCAREKQAHQAWESRLGGPLATGGSAAVGAIVSAIGAGVVKTSAVAGWAVIVVGVLLAIIGSVLSANTYVQNRNQKLRYLRLLYDLWDYAYVVLPTASEGRRLYGGQRHPRPLGVGGYLTSPAIAPTPMGARRVHPSRVMPRAGSGSTIPKGSRVVLVLASGGRDPAHVRNRFDPDRSGLAWPPSPSRSTPRDPPPARRSSDHDAALLSVFADLTLRTVSR
jgi:hypothetical protein